MPVTALGRTRFGSFIRQGGSGLPKNGPSGPDHQEARVEPLSDAEERAWLFRCSP